jgi:excisionase family DNA binding protein
VNDLMTGKEVADLFLVDIKTVVRWADAGLIQSTRTPGGHRRYFRSDIEPRVSISDGGGFRWMEPEEE